MATCIHCGTGITAITHRLNDGFCMVCCDGFPGITGPKHLLAAVSAAEVDAELVTRGMPRGGTFHRWLRIKSRWEPGDRLVRFRSDLQQSALHICDGVLWQRGTETLSGIVLRTEWLSVGDEWMGEPVRFATPDEIADTEGLRSQIQPGDTVLHYRKCCDPEGIVGEGRAVFAMVRAERCVARVELGA